MTINMPVEAMNEKCINCPELEIDVFTKEKYDMKKISEGRTISAISGFDNVLKCKNWDETHETCPFIVRCRAIMDAVAEEIVKEATKNAKPAAKKTTTRKTTTKKTVAKK